MFLVALFFVFEKGLKKGIRCKSGAVPAAVNLFVSLEFATVRQLADGKAQRIGEPEDLPELF